MNGGAAAFLPFDANGVPCSVPSHGNPTRISGERTMLGRIGRQLMQHHGHHLAGVRAQCQIRTMEVCIFPGHVGRKFALHEFSHRYSVPLSAASKLMRRCHRFNAAGELGREIGS